MKKLRATMIVLALIFMGFLAYAHRQIREEVKFPLLPIVTTCCHYSYFSQPNFFDEAYKNAKPIKLPTVTVGDEQIKLPIRSILVNHHLLASSYIAESFNQVATTAPITVLLISPNHFDVGRGSIISSAESWQTPYGMLQPDSSVVKKLSDASLASIEEDPFLQEHGVSGIVAFIKKSLPNARIVPVIFRNRMTLAQAQTLADQYHAILPSNILIVGSFDFSHYLPSRAADFHDIQNLNAVENLKFSSLYNLDIDSRPGLAFFLQLTKDYGDQKFTLLEHSNSAKLSHQDIFETTSYITGYFSEGQQATESVATLLSLGPIVPSQEILPAFNRYKEPFVLAYMERLLYGQDATISFLENPDIAIAGAMAKFHMGPVVQNVYSADLGPLKVKILDCTKRTIGDPHKGIDEGFDVVICQGAAKSFVEFYHGKPIVYAAGNFFDESTVKNSKQSLAVGLAFQYGLLQIFFFPTGMDHGQMKLLTGKEDGTVLLQMAENSLVPTDVKNQIKAGIITLQIK